MGKNAQPAPPPPPPPAPAAPSTSALQLGLVALGLGLVTLLAYLNSFQAGLVLDNSVLIVDDPRIRAWTPENVQAILTRNYWWPMFESDLYRPLTTLSYLFNYGVLGEGEHVFGYHVINFLLHWANVSLVLVIVRRLAGKIEIAAIAAAIFAVHPVNIESVTNIVGRADLLATLSILLGGWCYMWAAEDRRAGEAPGLRKLLGLTGLAFNALWGVFAKESAVMICVFLFFYDLVWRWPQLPGGNFGKKLVAAAWRFGICGYTALLPALAALGVVRHWLKTTSPVFGQIYVDNPVSHSWMPLAPPMSGGIVPDSWFFGFLTAIKVLGHYLQLLVFPLTLSSEYSYDQIPLYGAPNQSLENGLAWLALVVIATLIYFAIRLRRTNPLFTWSVGLFFLMQLLTANLLFPIGTIMGERFLYLPSVGFAVVAAQLLSLAMQALRRRSMAGPTLVWVLPAFVIIALGARTYARNQDWQDSLSLWKSAVQAAPNSFKSYKGYANALWDEGRSNFPHDPAGQEKTIDAAIPVMENGLRILDHPPLPIDKADNTLFQDLGMLYRLKGDYLAQRTQLDEAKHYYQKSLASLLRAEEVDHWVNKASRESSLARGRAEKDIADVGNFHIYALLEVTYDRLGDLADAEASVRYVLRLVPSEGSAYRMAANVLYRERKLNDAAVFLLEAGLLDNNDDNAWKTLAELYQNMGLPPGLVRIDGPNHTLDNTNPIVHQQLNDAAVALVQQFLDAKQYDSARAYRDKFVNQLKIPAELFPKF